jgi:predicted PurR-regulated permease PerM
MPDFYLEDHPMTKQEKKIMRYVIAGGVVVLVAAPIIAWSLGVFTSGVHGTGEIIKQNNNANNRIAATQTWTAAYKDVQRDQANVSMLKAKANTADAQSEGFLTDAQSVCNDDVVHYNTLHSALTIKDWKPAELPESFDLSSCN